uniref:mitoferrin-1-like isoform X1 n=1 Tax=Myxine glutinosa TaxID=7769 RepID=UPI00358FA296
MDNFDQNDYECLPPSATVTTHMIAGAMAGIMEHCVMYPVDCVKTRMQSLRPDPRAAYRNVFHALLTIVRTEGIWRPVRGVNAMATGAGPAHALYFACYERIKAVLSEGRNSHLANGVAGCAATLLHDATMNPAEVVKQRLQMYNSPYRGAVDCVTCVLRVEGLRAFYRSYPTQLALNLPFQSLHFVTYEASQEMMNGQRIYSPVTHMLSGGIAGGLAAAVTTPLDVCKTLLNTQEMALVQKGGCGHEVPGTPLGMTFGSSRADYLAPGTVKSAWGTASSATRTNPAIGAKPSLEMRAGTPKTGATILALLQVYQAHHQESRPASHALGATSFYSGGGKRPPHCHPPHYLKGLVMAFRTVYRLGGLSAFFRGMQARILYQVPSTAISWSVYEFFKHSFATH